MEKQAGLIHMVYIFGDHGLASDSVSLYLTQHKMCLRAAVVPIGSTVCSFVRSSKTYISKPKAAQHTLIQNANMETCRQAVCCLFTCLFAWILSVLKRWSRENKSIEFQNNFFFVIWLHFSILKFCLKRLSFNVLYSPYLCRRFVSNNWTKWCQSLVIRSHIFAL